MHLPETSAAPRSTRTTIVSAAPPTVTACDTKQAIRSASTAHAPVRGDGRARTATDHRHPGQRRAHGRRARGGRRAGVPHQPHRRLQAPAHSEGRRLRRGSRRLPVALVLLDVDGHRSSRRCHRRYPSEVGRAGSDGMPSSAARLIRWRTLRIRFRRKGPGQGTATRPARTRSPTPPTASEPDQGWMTSF